MVRTTNQINLLVKQFAKELEKIHIRAKTIFLFGSYARGNPKTYSDIDLLVISDDFETIKPINRLEKLSLASMPLNAPIEAIGYSTKELKKSKGQSIFWDQIKDDLKPLYTTRSK